MLTKEKLQHHISHLQEKHDELEKRLEKDPPEYISAVLKKEKLQLKDEIENCKRKVNSLNE